MSDPSENYPDWPPIDSAFNYPQGTAKFGSTGQLWKVTNGQWVRCVIIPRARYEALIVATKFLMKHGPGEFRYPFREMDTRRQEFDAIDAALRAAGIQMEDKADD